MTDETKEKIKLETELLRYLVLIGVALGGSTLGILISLPVGIRLLLVSLGIVATIGIGYMSWRQYLKIQRLIGGAA
ncbi:MAG: hypothetical protein HYZ50_11805 [Deltaproteobacteria bacterium]|nr:hypothetical protein [Deltaproteobacteria bacterium]